MVSVVLISDTCLMTGQGKRQVCGTASTAVVYDSQAARLETSRNHHQGEGEVGKLTQRLTVERPPNVCVSAAF